MAETSYEASKYSFTKTMNQIFAVEGKKKNTFLPVYQTEGLAVNMADIIHVD